MGYMCKFIVFLFSVCSSSFFCIVSLTEDYFSADSLGLSVECDSVKLKGLSSQTGALDPANAARPKEGTKETITTAAVTYDVEDTGVYIPTSDEILHLRTVPHVCWVDIDVIDYATNYTTKMKAKFSYCDEIKFNEPVLTPETPD